MRALTKNVRQVLLCFLSMVCVIIAFSLPSIPSITQKQLFALIIKSPV